MFEKERLEQLKRQEEEIERQSILDFSPTVLDGDKRSQRKTSREIIELAKELKKSEKTEKGKGEKKEIIPEKVAHQIVQNQKHKRDDIDILLGDNFIEDKKGEFDDYNLDLPKKHKKSKSKNSFEEIEFVKPKKKIGFLKGLLVVAIAYSVIMLVFVGGYFGLSFFYQSQIAREYEMTDKSLFYLDSFNGNNIRVSKFVDNKIYFNIKNVSEKYRQTTVDALNLLEKELNIFDIVIVTEDTANDIEIRSFTSEEHSNEINKTDGADNKYVGWCSMTSKGYDFIQKKYSREYTVIAIDTIQHNIYLNSVNKEEGKKHLVNAVEKANKFFTKTANYDKEIVDILNLLGDENAKAGDKKVFELAELLDLRLEQNFYSEENVKQIEEICGNFYNVYLNFSSEGVYQKYSRTVIHEALHAIFFVQDIANSQNPYFDTAKSIMSYNPSMRSYRISEFDQKYIIRPQIVNILLKNRQLCETLGYDYAKIEKEAEVLEVLYPFE